MDDAAGSSMLEQVGDRARHTLTVHRVAEELAGAGVPRSERRIKHFCQIGTLAAKKFPTPTGPQWFIDPGSLPGLIGDLKQFDEQARSRLQHAASDPIIPKTAPEPDPPAAGSSMLEPAAAVEKTKDDGGVLQPAPTAYISQLEKRIEEKDETIKFLQDELVDRRAQIGGMKAIIDGQRQLLETINNNVAPVFGALAQLVRAKAPDSDTIRATVLDGTQQRSEGNVG